MEIAAASRRRRVPKREELWFLQPEPLAGSGAIVRALRDLDLGRRNIDSRCQNREHIHPEQSVDGAGEWQVMSNYAGPVDAPAERCRASSCSPGLLCGPDDWGLVHSHYWIYRDEREPFHKGLRD